MTTNELTDNETVGQTEEKAATAAVAATPESEKKAVMLVYILQAVGFLFGFTFIAAVIVNYVKRGDLQSELAKNHFSYQIRTFWWSAGWSVLSLILAVVIVGYITLFITFCWTLYRVIKGLMKFNDGKLV